MSSDEQLDWMVVKNTVAPRMIDDSLTHKFPLARKIRKRTKILNAELQKRTIKSYDLYVAMKTSVLRRVANDYDTDDSNNFSESDYTIIHNSESKLNEYRIKECNVDLYTSDENLRISQPRKRAKKTSRARFVGRKKSPPVNKKQQENSVLQMDFSSSQDEEQNKEENQTMKETKKNSKRNSKSKLQECRIEESNTDLHTSNGNLEVSQAKRRTVKINRTKFVGFKKHPSVNMSRQKDVATQTDFISCQCDKQNEKENKAMDTSDENLEVSRAMKKSEKTSRTKFVGYKKVSSVNKKQQKKFTSQMDFTNSSSQNDERNEEENITTKKTKKNGKTKPVKEDVRKCVNIEEENVMSQLLYTSDENDDSKESCVVQTTKKKYSDQPKRSITQTKKSINIGWQEVKKNRNVSFTSINEPSINTSIISQHTFQDGKHDNSGIVSNKSSSTSKLQSQDDLTPCITQSQFISNSVSQNNSIIAMMLNLDSQNDTTLCKQEPAIEDTSQNHENSKTAVTNETISKSNQEDSTSVGKVDLEEKTTAQEESLVMNELYDPLNLQFSSNDDIDIEKFKLDFGKVHSSPINKQSSLISERQSSALKDYSCEKSTVKKKQGSTSTKNHENAVSPKSFKLIDDVKKNLTFILDTIDSHQSLSPNAVHDQQKDSGIDEESQDKIIKRLDIKKQDNKEDTTEEISVSTKPEKIDEVVEKMQKDESEETSTKVEDVISKKPDIVDDVKLKEEEEKEEEEEEEETNSSRSDPTNKEDEETNEKDTTGDLLQVQKKQLQPIVTSTEIVSKKYRIINERTDDVETHEEAESKLAGLHSPISCLGDDNFDSPCKTINRIPIEHKVDQEIDTNEESHMSTQTKNLLQQQATLNLIVDSDSSDSETENEQLSVTDHSCGSHTNDVNCIEDDDEDNEANRDVSEESHTDASHSDDAREEKARSSLSSEKENHSSEKNVRNVSYAEDACQQRRKSFESDERNHASEESGIDISHDKDNREGVCVREERPGSFERVCLPEKRHGSAVLDGRNTSDRESEAEQNPQWKPCNLEELVEDQKLVVETLSPSFTLADISENEEAFILNIPDKILQCNLQDQRLILKEELIKFGENKFRVVHNNVSAVSFVFASGKRRKSYELVNLKEISTITVRERLPHPAENSTRLDFYDADVSPKQKSRKRRITFNSDSEVDDRQMRTKKQRIINDYKSR